MGTVVGATPYHQCLPEQNPFSHRGNIMGSFHLYRAFAPLALAIAMFSAGPTAKTLAQSNTKSKSAAPAALVDINTASLAQLEEVPGIGPTYAKEIIAARPYASLEELSK